MSGVGNLGNSPEGIRVYDEMKREFSASVHGRRDAFRALLRAIKAARELISSSGLLALMGRANSKPFR